MVILYCNPVFSQQYMRYRDCFRVIKVEKMKKAYKFWLIVFVYGLLTIVTTTAMPYSQTFKEASVESDPMSAVYLQFSSALFCFTICFIAANAN